MISPKLKKFIALTSAYLAILAWNSALAQEVQSEQPSPAQTTTKLYGRIEQIAGSPGAQFPIVLKPQMAKMDTRAVQQKASASESTLSGSLVKSYPTNYQGIWGGQLKIWSIQQAPLAWQIDSDEAKWTSTAFKPGLVGQVNFQFQIGRNNQVSLEPAQIAFTVPMKDTNYQEQLNQMLGSNSSQSNTDLTRQMVESMASSMTVPLILGLGNIQTNEITKGVSGNQFKEQVLRNTIRELTPGVLEQQILTSSSERNPKTGQVRYGYGESVIRFTRQAANQLYVLVASVNYTQNRQFKRKIILYGTVKQGQKVDNNPNPLAGFGLPGGQRPQLPSSGQNSLQNLLRQLR